MQRRIAEAVAIAEQKPRVLQISEDAMVATTRAAAAASAAAGVPSASAAATSTRINGNGHIPLPAPVQVRPRKLFGESTLTTPTGSPPRSSSPSSSSAAAAHLSPSPLLLVPTPLLSHNSSEWRPDESTHQCRACHQQFTSFVRRHHCR